MAATEAVEAPATPARVRFSAATAPGSRGRVRLRTLSNLRWMAIGGQSAALFVVYFGLSYKLPLFYCAAVIGASALLNVALSLRYPASHRLNSGQAVVYLAFDVVQLAALLYLTGGIENPFALMFVAPVVIAAATLDLWNILLLGALAFIAVSSVGGLCRDPARTRARTSAWGVGCARNGGRARAWNAAGHDRRGGARA